MAGLSAILTALRSRGIVPQIPCFSLYLTDFSLQTYFDALRYACLNGYRSAGYEDLRRFVFDDAAGRQGVVKNISCRSKQPGSLMKHDLRQVSFPPRV
jgi:hypothetical protein